MSRYMRAGFHICVHAFVKAMNFCRTCALSPRTSRNPVLAAPGHHDHANFMMNPVSWITGCRKGRCTFLERKICTLPALKLGDAPCSARRRRLGKDILGSVHPGSLHQHGEWAWWGASSCCAFREMQSVVEPRSQTSGLEHFVCTGTALRGVQHKSANIADCQSPDA